MSIQDVPDSIQSQANLENTIQDVVDEENTKTFGPPPPMPPIRIMDSEILRQVRKLISPLFNSTIRRVRIKGSNVPGIGFAYLLDGDLNHFELKFEQTAPEAVDIYEYDFAKNTILCNMYSISDKELSLFLRRLEFIVNEAIGGKAQVEKE